MATFSLPLFGQVEEVPYHGNSVETRSASLSGAVHASQGRRTKLDQLREIIREHGPLTMNAMAEKSGWPLSSICSLHACLKPELEPVGHQTVKIGRNTTKRTRWRLRKEVTDAVV